MADTSVQSIRVNTAIVGGGPAGLSAAVQSAARGKSVCVLSGADPALSKAELVDNYLGLPRISGADIMGRFLEHAKALDIVPYKGRAVNILPYGGRFMLNAGLEGGKTAIVESDTVILATGAARARAVDGEAGLLGRGVSYCATCDGMLYRGKRAVVWGSASDIVEETLFLHNIGVNVIFMSKEEKPDALGDIEHVRGTLSRVAGDSHVTAAITDGGVSVDADAVFILRDFIAPSALISGLSVEKGRIAVNEKMETNIPGVFAAGDCTGSLPQIACAVGGGLTAAHNASIFKSRN